STTASFPFQVILLCLMCSSLSLAPSRSPETITQVPSSFFSSFLAGSSLASAPTIRRANGISSLMRFMEVLRSEEEAGCRVGFIIALPDLGGNVAPAIREAGTSGHGQRGYCLGFAAGCVRGRPPRL